MSEEFSYEGRQCICHISGLRADRDLNTIGGSNHFAEVVKSNDCGM